MKYVALGDSAGVGIGSDRGVGYVDLLYARIARARGAKRATIRNLCMSGATSRTVRERQIDATVAERPDLVTLFIGGNDVWRGITPAEYAGHLQVIGERLSKTGASVFLANLADLSHAPAAAIVKQWFGIDRDAIGARVRELNAAIAATCARHGFALVDLFHEEDLRAHPEYFCGDGFHPSDAGYEAMTEAMWRAVSPRLRDAA